LGLEHKGTFVQLSPQREGNALPEFKPSEGFRLSEVKDYAGRPVSLVNIPFDGSGLSRYVKSSEMYD